MIDLNDLQSSVAGTSSVQPPPPPHGYQSDHTGSEKETVLMSNRHASKPEWLEAAEEKVKQHLGPGRSSHDFAHADRIRRQALCLAKIQSRTHGHVDMRVVELSALFVTATCDPKHHVEDPKDFVKAFASEQPGCLDSEQLELVVRITRATGVKKEERRRREKRETDWHRTCRELHW